MYIYIYLYIFKHLYIYTYICVCACVICVVWMSGLPPFSFQSSAASCGTWVSFKIQGHSLSSLSRPPQRVGHSLSQRWLRDTSFCHILSHFVTFCQQSPTLQGHHATSAGQNIEKDLTPEPFETSTCWTESCKIAHYWALDLTMSSTATTSMSLPATATWRHCVKKWKHQHMVERCRKNLNESCCVGIGFVSTEARTTLLHHGKGPAGRKEVSGYCQTMDLLNREYFEQGPRHNVGWVVSVVKTESKFRLQREEWNHSICSLASSASLSPSICWSSSSKPSHLKKSPSQKLGIARGRQLGQRIPRRTYESQSGAKHCLTLPLGVFQPFEDLTGHKNKVLRELALSPSFPFLNQNGPNIFAFWGDWNAHIHNSGLRQARVDRKKYRETRSAQISFVPSRFRF